MIVIEETSKVLSKTNGSDDFQHELGKNSDPIVSAEAGRVIELIFQVALCGILGLFGSTTNVINIIIFCMQGFNDSVNISLVSLSVSDLGILITLLWTSICYNPLFRYSNLGFDVLQVEYITAGWPNGCCLSITSWITAFITFERCVCIALPLKVKDIISSKVTLIVVVATYLLIICSVMPFFCSVYFDSSFYHEHNKTLIGVKHVNNDISLVNVTSSMLIVVQLSSFIIVIICSMILILHLQAKSQWRRKVISVPTSLNENSLSSRDKRVMKMVTIISCTFIVCYLPGAINLILMVQLYPDYSVVGQYHTLYSASWSIFSTLEAINSSINFFIYFKMSSRFRDAVNTLFGTRSSDIKTM